MMSLTGTVVAGAMGAIMMLPMLQLQVTQAQGRANLEATVLWEAEVDRARREWSLNYEDFDLLEVSNQQRCAMGDDHGYVEGGFNFDVRCTVGDQIVGKNMFILPFPEVSRNPGQYSDSDGNGFEDVTGLPTHYDQCYSGWKGNGWKQNCTLGGQYIIPMYASLYANGEPVNGISGGATDSTNQAYTPGVYCPPWDTTGTISFNTAHNVRCIPTDGSVDNGNMNGVNG